MIMLKLRLLLFFNFLVLRKVFTCVNFVEASSALFHFDFQIDFYHYYSVLEIRKKMTDALHQDAFAFTSSPDDC